MLRFIQDLFAAESKPANRKNRRKSRPAKHNQRRVLGLEGLDSRNLMAGLVATVDPKPVLTAQVVAPKTVTVEIKNGDLSINGTDGADNIAVSYESGKYVVKDTHDVNGKAVTALIRVSGSLVTGGDIIFNGNKGDDRFSVANTINLRVTANGGDGNDILTGGGGADTINGGDGNDQLYGSYGTNTLNGGKGDDTIYGGPANDIIDGGENADHIYGSGGNDIIFAGTDFAPNFVDGAEGNDTITGGYGADELHGGAGNDTIDGSYGEDYLYGDGGNDTLFAGNDSGYNYLDGGSGDDILWGSYGGDYMAGGDGNDQIHGGAGDDTIFGNHGSDTLYGDAGNDWINGGSQTDDIHGGDGDDSLNGGNDDDCTDRMWGEAGVDTFYYEQNIVWGYDSPNAELRDWVQLVDIMVAIPNS